VGNIFYGSEGYMVVKKLQNWFETYLGPRREKGPARGNGWRPLREFSKKPCAAAKTSDQNGPVETAHLSSGLAHLGNISHRLERQLAFEPGEGAVRRPTRQA